MKLKAERAGCRMYDADFGRVEGLPGVYLGNQLHESFRTDARLQYEKYVQTKVGCAVRCVQGGAGCERAEPCDSNVAGATGHLQRRSPVAGPEPARELQLPRVQPLRQRPGPQDVPAAPAWAVVLARWPRCFLQACAG